VALIFMQQMGLIMTGMHMPVMIKPWSGKNAQ